MFEIIVQKSKRGFASRDPERQRAIASKGGVSVPAERRSFATDPDPASKAGKIGRDGDLHDKNRITGGK